MVAFRILLSLAPNMNEGFFFLVSLYMTFLVSIKALQLYLRSTNSSFSWPAGNMLSSAQTQTNIDLLSKSDSCTKLVCKLPCTLLHVFEYKQEDDSSFWNECNWPKMVDCFNFALGLNKPTIQKKKKKVLFSSYWMNCFFSYWVWLAQKGRENGCLLE